MGTKYSKVIAVLMSSLFLVGCQNSTKNLTESVNNTKHQAFNDTGNQAKNHRMRRPSNNLSNSTVLTPY